MKKMKGKVIWFNPALGYGFINNKNIKNDIYIHYSDIECNGYKKLYKNDIVNFLYDEENIKAIKVNLISKGNQKQFQKI